MSESEKERLSMSRERKLETVDRAIKIFRARAKELGADEVAVVRNPSYVYGPMELYPLAPKPPLPLPRLAGIVKDMDGTTTTTEPLCLHSLEWMVRQVTGRLNLNEWEGLDHAADYPHIIGNSTTKHVEYLIETYADAFNADACLRAYVHAAAWTLSHGRDPGRRREVRASIPALGLAGIWQDGEFQELATNMGNKRRYDPAVYERLGARLAQEFAHRFRVSSLTDRVRASVDIYYMRYHVILGDIADGKGAQRAEEVLGSRTATLIEPMPGVAVFLAAMKGLLGGDLRFFAEPLLEHVRKNLPDVSLETGRVAQRLEKLGRYLEAHPVPVAVVTSSIAYEANIVLGEVFSILRRQVEGWPLPQEQKELILRHLESPGTYYDAIVTASDSSEIRLKPHRDLYSIALHTMGLSREDYCHVLGFEDSESGVVAIRAAGVGMALAVPFVGTEGHDLSAAARILPGQIPEVLAVHGCFLEGMFDQ
jgi:beta-phosphoglucomutase-like phosphatase (HAD superfamily)